jgi:hypothetical protein
MPCMDPLDGPYEGWEHWLVEHRHPRTGTRHLSAHNLRSTACGKPVDKLEVLGQGTGRTWEHPLACAKCQRALKNGQLGFQVKIPMEEIWPDAFTYCAGDESPSRYR